MRKTLIESGLIIPILLGVFSVAGLCVVLIFGRLNNSRQVIQVTETETPFRFIYLGTEPSVLGSTQTDAPAAPETPAATDIAGASTATRRPRPTPISLTAISTNTVSAFTSTPSRTPTSVSTTTPGASTYDDTDFRLVYSGSWDAGNDIEGVYQKTLHVSNTIGDSVTFSFLGQQVQISYQAGPSLGTVTITLDGLGIELPQNQANTTTKKWNSGVLVQGTHTVVITHTAGGSVNIDSIIIPDVRTATPTSTP